MRSRGSLALAALLLPLGLLAGCSGDDEPDSDAPDPAATKTETRAACTAEVTVKGGVKARWKGDAFAVTENRSGPTVYKTAKGPNTLTVLAEDGDSPSLASLATKKDSYSGSEGTFEVDPDGSGAEVEATLRGGGGTSAELVASITCE
jgi:hypothetical protein